MKEVYDYALKEGVKLAVEPINRFETYFVSRANQAIALAKATGPECGVCLDAFHLNIEEIDPYEAIRSAKGLLVDFHDHDALAEQVISVLSAPEEYAHLGPAARRA